MVELVMGHPDDPILLHFLNDEVLECFAYQYGLLADGDIMLGLIHKINMLLQLTFYKPDGDLPLAIVADAHFGLVAVVHAMSSIAFDQWL